LIFEKYSKQIHTLTISYQSTYIMDQPKHKQYHDTKPERFIRYISEGNIKKIRRAVKFGYDINAEIELTNMTTRLRYRTYPLIVAVERSQLSIVKLFIGEYGADMYVSTNGDEGAILFIAAKNNYVKIARYLLESQMNPNGINEFEETALIFAVRYHHTRMIDLLIDNGANIDQDDCIGYSPLFYAYTDGYLDIVKQLISRGANINHVNHRGGNLLFVSTIKAMNNKVIDYIFECGIDYKHKDERGDDAVRSWRRMDETDAIYLYIKAYVKQMERTIPTKGVQE